MKAENRNFYRSLASLVIPITIQNFITNAVNSADVFMLGYVGQTQLSAVSLANQFQFLLSGFFFGISSGVVMLASQYWGKKDTNSIQAVMGIATKIALAITLILAIGAVTVPESMMGIYTNDRTLITIGASYLRIVGISYVCMSFSQVYHCTLRSMERAQLSTVISSVALLLNVVLNAVFIFGIGGAPKLGVIGVAVGTTAARVAELVLCLADAVRGKIFRMDLKIMFGKNKLLFADFCRYSLPALVNDFAWTFAFSTYSVIMGHMNADVVAASSVATTVRNLCTILCFALGSGASVLLGIRIGEGRLEEAKQDARKSCQVTLIIGILTGVIILLLRPVVFMCFSLTERAVGYLDFMLWISAYYVVGQAMNTLLIAGVFRAGGDSRFGMICDIIVMWCISVPLGFLSAFVWKLPPMAVYFILCLDEFWKIPVVYVHYKKFGWLKDITRKL
ncbi:MAG: MATE family efflux transporter [Lachnospiraceae bacterium]|jgi:putative MATE family efflux protein|nr:MATE family efflux transporter [Lachnospiraceae bacterium]